MSNRVFPLLLLLCAAAASPAVAQHTPIPRMEDRNAERARYAAETRVSLDQLIGNLQAAWLRADPRALTRLHTSDAVIVHDRNVFRGRDSVEEAYTRVLPRVAQMRPGMTDFAVGGSLAYAFGSIALSDAGNPAAPPVSATYVLIARLEGSTWRVRSLVITADDAAE